MKKKNILFLFTSLVLSSNANASSFSHEFAEGLSTILERQGYFNRSNDPVRPNNNYTSYQGGYSEEEALRRALEESKKEESQRTFTQESRVKKTNKPTKEFKKKINKDSRLWFVNELSNVVINQNSLRGLDLLFSLTVDGKIENKSNLFLNRLTIEQKNRLFSYKGIGSDATYDEYKDIEQIFKNLYKKFGESNIKKSLKENFRYGNSNWDFLNTLYQVEYRKEEIDKYFYKQRIERCRDDELLEELNNSDNALLNKIAEVITGYENGTNAVEIKSSHSTGYSYFLNGVYTHVDTTPKEVLTKEQYLRYLIIVLTNSNLCERYDNFALNTTQVPNITGYSKQETLNTLEQLNEINPVLVKRMFRYLRDQYGYAKSIESIDRITGDNKFLDIYNDLSGWKKSLEKMNNHEINDEIGKSFLIIEKNQGSEDIFDIKKAEILVESFPQFFNNDFVITLLRNNDVKFVTNDFEKFFGHSTKYLNKTKLLRLLLNVEGVSKEYILKEMLENSGDSQLNIGAILENCKKEDIDENSKNKLILIFNAMLGKRQTSISKNYLFSKILDGCKIFDKKQIFNLFSNDKKIGEVFFNVKDEKGFWIFSDQKLVDYYKYNSFKEEIKKHIQNNRPWLINNIIEKKEKPRFRSLNRFYTETETAMNIGTYQVLNYMKALFDGGEHKGKTDDEIVRLLVEKLDILAPTNIILELRKLYNELKTANEARRKEILKIVSEKKKTDIRNSDVYNKILILSQLVRLKDSFEMDSHERKGILPIVMELVANNKTFETAFFNSMLAASESNPENPNPEVCKTTIYLASFFQEVYKDWLSSWTLGGFKKLALHEEEVLNKLLKLTFEIERIVSMLDNPNLEEVLLQEIGIKELNEKLTDDMPTSIELFSGRVRNSKEVLDAPNDLKFTTAISIEAREREAFKNNLIEAIKSLINFCKKVKDDPILSEAFLTDIKKCFEDFSKLTDAFESDSEVESSINNIFDNFKKEAEQHLLFSEVTNKISKKSILKEYFKNLIKEKTGIENAFDNEQYSHSPLIKIAFENICGSLGIKEIKKILMNKPVEVIKTTLEKVKEAVDIVLELIKDFPDHCKTYNVKVDLKNVIENLDERFKLEVERDPAKREEIENILKQLKKEKVY